MASLEEVITQVRLLTETQRQLETQLRQEAALRQNAETVVAQLRNTVGTMTGAPPPPPPQLQLVDTRMLGRPATWDGSDSGWKDWKFVTASYLLAAMPALEPLLSRAESDLSQSVLLADLASDKDSGIDAAVLHLGHAHEGAQLGQHPGRRPGRGLARLALAPRAVGAACGAALCWHAHPNLQCSSSFLSLLLFLS